MTKQPVLKKTLQAIMLTALLNAMLGTQAALATELENWQVLKTIKVKEFSKSLKIRGFKVGKGVYMGHAKVANKYGLGLVVDRQDYSWGVNNRGISVEKRF